LKGRRDRIPALRRKGIRGGKRPEKISHFLFGREVEKSYLCRPKSGIKKGTSKAEAWEGKSSLKL